MTEECFENDVALFKAKPVRGIRNFHIKNVMSADDCQQKCVEDSDCKFWTWNSPQFKRNKNTCWLKAEAGQRRSIGGKISGPKECK